MFLVDTFVGLTAPIASKQCQLMIDFATKPPSLSRWRRNHAMGLRCQAETGKSPENRALVALRSAAPASYVTKPARPGHLAVW